MDSVRVFNFSGVYREKEYRFNSGQIDFSGLEGTSCYLDGTAEDRIRTDLSAYSPGVYINFIDSGDYHYMTALLAEAVNVPFSLLLADNHPDMQEPAFGDILSCGGWVRKMLQSNPNLRRVLLVGIDPALESETLGYPDRVTVLTREHWTAAAIKDWLDAGAEPVYLSIDKDVLAPSFASTDWEQGCMTLDQLCGIAALCCSHGLCGADVCGELPASKGGKSEDFSLNNIANTALLSELFTIFEGL